MTSVIAIVRLDIDPLKTTPKGRLYKRDREDLCMQIEAQLSRLLDCWDADVIDIDTGNLEATLERQ